MNLEAKNLSFLLIRDLQGCYMDLHLLLLLLFFPMNEDVGILQIPVCGPKGYANLAKDKPEQTKSLGTSFEMPDQATSIPRAKQSPALSKPV